ncbi:MAG: hypothetical protein ACM3PP_05430, partial [Candidatus Saccharibacteria bacterium]
NVDYQYSSKWSIAHSKSDVADTTSARSPSHNVKIFEVRSDKGVRAVMGYGTGFEIWFSLD